MNIKELKEIIEIIRGTDIEELEIERDGMKIRVKKKSVAVTSTPVQPVISTPAGQTQEIPSAPSVLSSDNKSEAKELISIVSPMVGTFFRAPSPDADPYVELGSIVKKGQIVCIIEAMKLMNEIESEVDGKVVKILVENGQPVEYGQVLFEVEPA